MFMNVIELFVQRINMRRGLLFGLMIIAALLAFETFNYTTTDYALRDLLGDLDFLGIHWATILAIAFCGIDFAGIARLFTPEQGSEEPVEVWYLFGAWLLAATMNAMLTWWGVSLAILNHETLGNPIVDRETMLRVVPIFVAIMVWLIRVLIIGTFSLAGERLFTQANSVQSTSIDRSKRQWVNPPALNHSHPSQAVPLKPNVQSSFKPAPKSGIYNRSEPTYHFTQQR